MPFKRGQVHRQGARELDIGTCGVKVGVVRDALARTADGGEEDLFGGSTLVRWDDMPEGEEVLDRIEEAKP